MGRSDVMMKVHIPKIKDTGTLCIMVNYKKLSEVKRNNKILLWFLKLKKLLDFLTQNVYNEWLIYL